MAAYIKYATNIGLKGEILTSNEGHAIVKFKGKGASDAFRYEGGKHCVQRVPPTESKGRRHTSMITVAVLPLPPAHEQKPLAEADLDIKTQCGHGPGGQHQNKTASAVRMTHRPTGLQVFINGRDQHANRREALRILTAKVNAHVQDEQAKVYNAERKKQIGDGHRGNKIRTYNFIDSRAVDHRFNIKTGKIKDVMKGRFDILHP